MTIIILGAGKHGSYLASVLSKEEFDVILIDKNPKKLEEASRENDIATKTAFGSEWKILNELLEFEPSLFIAVTGNDETNLVSCTIAKNLGYPQTVAKIKDIGYLTKSKLDFGKIFYVDHFIAGEVLSAHDLLKSVINPQDLAIENFAHGSIQMRTIVIPEDWKKSHLKISELDLPEELIISLIRRETDEGEKILFPHGDDQIFPLDEVTIIGETKIMYQLHEIFQTKEEKIRSITIIGGSNVAFRCAKVLEKMNMSIKIIEKDKNRCEELAEKLPKATVIHHTGKDLDFLLAERIQETDVFIACMHKDEENMLHCLLAKKAGQKKQIMLLSDEKLTPILKELNIHFSLAEKINITNRILSILHGKSLISVASLCEDKAKVLEIKVSADSKIAGIPLSKLNTQLPKDLLIAAIENRGQVMIGKGNRIISPKDTIILITNPENMNVIQDLF